MRIMRAVRSLADQKRESEVLTLTLQTVVGHCVGAGVSATEPPLQSPERNLDLFPSQWKRGGEWWQVVVPLCVL